MDPHSHDDNASPSHEESYDMDAAPYHSDDEAAFSDEDPVQGIETGNPRPGEDAEAGDAGPGLMPRMAEEDKKLYQVASTFEGAAAVAMVKRPKVKAPLSAAEEEASPGRAGWGGSFRERLGVKSSRRHGKVPETAPATLTQQPTHAESDVEGPTLPGANGARPSFSLASASAEQAMASPGNGHQAQEHDAAPLKNGDISSSQEGARLALALASAEAEAEPGASAEMEKVLMITMEDGVTLEVELDSGEKRLNELGYKQELRRVLSFWQLYGVGVSFISIFTGVVPTFGQTMLNGGPAAAVWFWWIAVFFVHCVGLSFAEIASSFPTAGSLYFWSSALAEPKYSAAASFFTGWLQYFGSVAQTAAASYGGAIMVEMLILLASGGAANGGKDLNDYEVFGVAVAIVTVGTMLVILPIDVVASTFVVSAVLQVLGAVALIICLPAVATVTQPASWVFGNFEVQWDITNTPNTAYAVIIGMLMSQYCLYEYDGVVHLAEETKVSDVTGPQAIMGSVTTVSLVAWGIVVALCFCTTSIPDLVAPTTATGGIQPVVQVLYDVFYTRYGSVAGAQFFTFIFFLSFFFATAAAILGASRVCYSLSRDGGFPFSRIWRTVYTPLGTPLKATLVSAGVGLLLLLPLLVEAQVFSAIISISTVGWVGSYAIPIFLRLIQKESRFNPGPFYLPDYIGVTGGKVVHGLALFWVVYTVIVFNLPTQFPITASNFNWTPVATAIWALLLLLWWFIDARHWFLGPILRLEKLRAQPSQQPL